MTVEITFSSAEKIEQFCDNLKKSMLAYIQSGFPVHVESKADMEPVYAGEHSFLTGTPADYQYMGETYVIKIGRPATKKMSAEMQKSMIEEWNQIHQPQPDHTIGGK